MRKEERALDDTYSWIKKRGKKKESESFFWERTSRTLSSLISEGENLEIISVGTAYVALNDLFFPFTMLAMTFFDISE